MLVRDPAKARAFEGRTAMVVGDLRDATSVAPALAGAVAVASALGPVG